MLPDDLAAGLAEALGGLESLLGGLLADFPFTESYLNYGRNAARAGNLDITNTTTNPCISTGYDGYYEYNGINYKATSPARGANFYKCSKLTKRILNIKTPCNFGSCTFNGAWSGGGGAGQKTIYVASYFYEMTAEAGVIPLDVPSGKVRPVDFKNAAKLACKTRVEDMTTVFPQITSGNEPFLCMDFMYAYTLLVDGFGLHPSHELTAMNVIDYQSFSVEVAWPLGCAIDVVSMINNPVYEMNLARLESLRLDAASKVASLEVM
ncbi:nucleotide phosphatase [Lithospermum erythrorhizon]|uniref:Nucleotide phosphatase n=1 Tax=Lithospermum erythrorhizon TaxID=34254 RepID=A0AAV3QWR6_LITER